jgi:hypothetical protein
LLALRGEDRSKYESSDAPTDGPDDGGAEVLARRGVYLAGEHTAPFVVVGTVAGAYMAGEAAAGRVLEDFGC